MKQNNLKLDPDHPYYRICPYPPCQTAFMTENKLRDYCCDQHADADYNRYRKLKKANTGVEKNESVTPLETKTEVSPVQKTEAFNGEINIDVLKKNIEIFSRLAIDKEDGTIYNIQHLEKLGINFTQYSYTFPLCNTKDSHCVLFGNYETYLVNPKEVLIYFKNH